MASTLKLKSRDRFVRDLMKRMTLQEKIGQLNLLSLGFDVTGPVLSEGVEEKIQQGLVGGILNSITPPAVRKLQQMALNTRLQIPLLMGYDVIHGHRTIFPVPLALACSWNMDLIERTARAAAEEATADGVNWVYSPMVDICRDARWGRITEGSGEDPFLGSAIARAMVHGYQGKDLSDPANVIACVKHFALYGGAEAGRDYNTVDMSLQRMFNEYMPPYQAAIEAGALSVMTSFNEVNGVPSSGNKWLLTELLRKKWKFPGFVATDYTAINEMIDHGMGGPADVAELALTAGTDMDMVGELFIAHCEKLLAAKRISMEDIDIACRRILESKYDLGLFTDPYRAMSDERVTNVMLSEDKLELSKQAAVESIVLLKNAGPVLPLNREKRIAFIGPLVKDQRNLLGSWSAAGDAKDCVSLWKALEDKFGADQFLYAKGCNLVDDNPDLLARLNEHGGGIEIDGRSKPELIAEAVMTAALADVVVAVLGEPCVMTGEAASRSDIGLLPNQVELLNALKWMGKPIVLVLMNGRPLTISEESGQAEAILETWFAGTMAGPAIVDVLFGDANPSGKLAATFPRNVGQIPVYYNHKNTGRPLSTQNPGEWYRSRYLDVSNEPLYPFGFGLSYTTFEYSDISLSKTAIKSGQSLTASVAVTNTGTRAGTETVQMYVRDLVGSVTRPVKELKGFRRIELQPGESTTVQFKLSSKDLKFYDARLRFKAEPGEFKLFIGSNSRDVKEAGFSLLPRAARGGPRKATVRRPRKRKNAA